MAITSECLQTACDQLANCAGGLDKHAFRQLVAGLLCEIATKVEAGGGGGGGDYTTENAAISITTSSASSNTTAGLASVSIANIGDADGTVDGETLEPGEVVSFNSYEDPVNRVFNRIPAISFDATGTTFRIITQA